MGWIAGGVAVAGLAGSVISSGAAQSAAQTQADAANQASANQMAQYNQTRADLSPFTNSGTNALGSLNTILGLPGGNGINPLAANGIGGLTYQPSGAISNALSNPTFAPTQAQLESTPGYQFNLAQGQQAVANSSAAQGRGISGAALKGAANYATGLANNTLSTQASIFQNNYSNALQANQQGQGIFQSNLGNVLNPLSNLANQGQNSAATTGQQGIAAVGNANQALIGGANASAAGTVGSANAISSGLGSVGQAPLNSMLYSQLLNGGGSNANNLNGNMDTTF